MTKPKLQLEEGKYYRTRSGQRVGPIERVAAGVGGFSQERGQHWRVDGRYYYDDGRFMVEHGTWACDLVAEWTDESADATEGSDAERSELERLPTETQEEHLRRLVRVANAGLAAVKELHAKPELKDQVEWRDNTFGWEPLHAAFYNGDQLRIKPKPRPKFLEFYVGGPTGSSWVVSLSGEPSAPTLHVGCRKFDARAAMTALQSLGRDHYSETSFIPGLKATRAGLFHEAGTLSWADADRLLAALEAYFKEAA